MALRLLRVQQWSYSYSNFNSTSTTLFIVKGVHLVKLTSNSFAHLLHFIVVSLLVDIFKLILLLLVTFLILLATLANILPVIHLKLIRR